MDMGYYKNYNKVYRFILVCIDVYSRRVFMRALKSKSAENTMRGVESIEEEFIEKGYKIRNIIADKGSEFINKLFLNHFKDIKEKIFFKEAEIHNSSMAVIDRVIRTLRYIFKKVFVVNGNYYWLDGMYKIERNYNNGYRFILVCIDIYSRRVFMRALKSKSAENTMRGIISIEEEFIEKGYKI